MADMKIVNAKAVEFLENKGCNIIQNLGDIVIFEDEDYTVVCRIKYTVGKYEEEPTNEECENIMISTLMDANIDKLGRIRFDEIQVCYFGNGHALLRHHSDIVNS